MISPASIGRRMALAALPFALCAGMARACPEQYTDKVAATPDLTQTDPEAGFPHRGQLYCGPVAASDALMWLAEHGFPKLKPEAPTSRQSQIAMVNLLAGADMMNVDGGGTGPYGLVRGVEAYVRKSGYRAERLECRGWRRMAEPYQPKADTVDMAWVREIVSNPAGAVWLNVGFYTIDAKTSTYARDDGHWVAVVGYGVDAQGKPDPSVLIIHDPSPRSGPKPMDDYWCIEAIKDNGTLTGQYAGLPRTANGQYLIKDGMRIMRGTDCAISDLAVGLVVGR